MCRFLIIRSNVPFTPGNLIAEFAEMARNSLSPEGDRQGDGWGAAWIDQSSQWKSRKSLQPIWECPKDFTAIPACNLLLLHARSASFSHHIGIEDYLQPFCTTGDAFVFNGLIQGVTFPYPVQGEIGSQKIWNLLQSLLAGLSAGDALAELIRLIERHSRRVRALNLGIVYRDRVFVTSHFDCSPEYYTLHHHQSNGSVVICSEPLESLDFQPLESRKVHCF